MTQFRKIFGTLNQNTHTGTERIWRNS